MKTLSTNKDNDIFTVNGNLSFATDRRCQTIILDTAILTQKGEMQFDDDVGVDYMGTVFVNHSYIALWAAEVKKLVQSYSFVKSIKKFEYEIDTDENAIVWSMSVLNQDDEELVLGSSRENLNGSIISLNKGWGDIRHKPKGIEDIMSTIDKIGSAAGDKPHLTPASTMADVKTTLNDVAIKPLKSNT